MNTPTKIIIPESKENFIIHHPSGKVEFVGWIGLIKFAWNAVKTKTPLVVSEKGKEEPLNY